MIRRLLLILVVIIPEAYATSLVDGANNAQSLIGHVDQASPLSSDPKNAVPGFVTSSPSETNYSNGGMSDASTQKALSDPASQLINRSFTTRPDIKIERSSSPIFRNSKTVTDNPTAIVNFLTGRYGDCQTGTTVTSISSDIRTCDEYTETTDQTCQVGVNVTVDANHQYKCNRSRVYNDYTCNRSLTLSCAVHGGDAGAITTITIPSPTIWTYNYPLLEINSDFTGTPPTSFAPPGFGGISTTTYVRNIIFNVSDLNKISQFSLTAAYFKNFPTLTVNNQQVYKFQGDPRSDVNKITTPLNLLPYLHVGSNTLTINILLSNVVANLNTMINLEITTTQTGCAQWNETWTDNCGAYK